MGFRTALFNARFWGASFERAVLTVIQALGAQVAVFSATDIEKLGLNGLPWSTITSVSVFAGLSSLLTSLGKAGATKGRGPGLVEQLTQKKAKTVTPSVGVTEPTAGSDGKTVK
ncbi:holin [Streptomyces sp. 5-10]|uniref:holin n=1 Tax=Streptomyces sp. 5-10 TaxID=878925 RepID=UPI00168AA114|nr:holin [Streptomyces sp. 5-10]MBD3004543.1 hypothetical protein [Streptomyces sp. 5-10]